MKKLNFASSHHEMKIIYKKNNLIVWNFENTFTDGTVHYYPSTWHGPCFWYALRSKEQVVSYNLINSISQTKWKSLVIKV